MLYLSFPRWVVEGPESYGPPLSAIRLHLASGMVTLQHLCAAVSVSRPTSLVSNFTKFRATTIMAGRGRAVLLCCSTLSRPLQERATRYSVLEYRIVRPGRSSVRGKEETDFSPLQLIHGEGTNGCLVLLLAFKENAVISRINGYNFPY